MMFPFQREEVELAPADFVRLRRHFVRTVQAFLPCRDVHFLPPELDGEEAGEMPAAWAVGVRMVQGQGRPALDAESATLFLPVEVDQQLLFVAVLAGCERHLLEASEGWLLDRVRLLIREFQLVKKWTLDPVTGLLNTRHMEEELQMLLAEQAAAAGNGDAAGDAENLNGRRLVLLLLEIYPRTGDAVKALQYINRASSYLETLIGNRAPLHYLGYGVFGLLMDGVEEDQAARSGEVLLRWLKQENFSRAHIGLVSLRGETPSMKGAATDRRGEAFAVLDAAWQALQTARGRGPYGLCTHDPSRAARESHPLAPAPEAVLGELAGHFRRYDRFALLILRRDQRTREDHFPRRLGALAGQEATLLPISPREAFVVLPDAGADQALAWLEAFKAKVRELPEAGGGRRLSFSAGVAVYPCGRFRKADMPDNARKALLHTAFFGEDTATLFSSVSLNISGDVFYNEGDLVRAAREYRLGLALDPGNVNLLNSLGVIHAQLNRYGKAIPLFEQVLALEPANFMALFNLGASWMFTNDAGKAVGYFEQALAVNDSHFDLLTQLGKLYCRAGRHTDAVRVLEQSEKVGEDALWPSGQPAAELGRAGSGSGGRGAIQRLLGEAHFALGNTREAMQRLQRATRANPRDAAALSLLAQLYAEAGQGLDIARTLAATATELDSSQAVYWLRLARIQLELGEKEAADESLRHCLRLSPREKEALRLLASLRPRQKTQEKKTAARGGVKRRAKKTDTKSGKKARRP